MIQNNSLVNQFYRGIKMQKRVLESSSHSLRAAQMQKFQLPLSKISQKKQPEQRSLYVDQNRNLQKVILGKLSEVQNDNKKLLTLASKINNSSLMFSDDQKLHQLIFTIEEQMKSAFNDLIQSIQEFYIDIDTKIKQIGSYLTSLSGVDTLETSSNFNQDFLFTNNQQQKSNKNQQQKGTNQLNDQDTLRSINHKIQMLQKDLDETKSNEKKLMTIIDKLVSKYELNHETTIVKEDPFLKKKVQNMMGKLQLKDSQGRFQIDNKRQQFSGDNSGRFFEANTFSHQNNYQTHQPHQNGVTIKSNYASSNVRKAQNPQLNVHQVQNPNDYSIYHELNKLDELNVDKQSFIQKQKHYGNNINQSMLKKKLTQKRAQNLGSSTVSVQSYAYSNSMSQHEQQQCFIKKLYSKQSPTLNKVSLKSCNQNNTFFQFNKQKQDVTDKSNKHHREAYLLSQLKR